MKTNNVKSFQNNIARFCSTKDNNYCPVASKTSEFQVLMQVSRKFISLFTYLNSL
ncbi:hypothetical protein THOD04_10201 [Vibrio owensii]|nr:hypothetical protein THOD04_10201 [Vibrio owensii]CAH1566625.1 hypothetical protein THZB04_20204 [Vibrio owensii]